MPLVVVMVVVVAWTAAVEAQESPGWDDGPIAEAEVDWAAEVREGGYTMVALGALSVGLVVFISERAIRLRGRKIIPEPLADRVVKLVREGQYDEVLALCRKDGSVFASAAGFVVEHRKMDPQLVLTGAGDLSARAIDSELERGYPLAVIAGLAPLLGLLGTMIGMIEAFELVKVFGDDGGASLLAGSISKALITTAVGLILAIPALVACHVFRHRVNSLASRLELATDRVFQTCFFRPATAGGPRAGLEGRAGGSKRASATAKTAPVPAGAGPGTRPEGHPAGRDRPSQRPPAAGQA